jgi:nucleoid DNA-binding protein
MKEMSKKDIIKYLRDEEFVLSKKDATIIINAIFDYIKDTLDKHLKSGEDLRFTIK